MQRNIQQWKSSLEVQVLNCKISLDDLVNRITEENKHFLQYNDDDVIGLEEW